jgi:hypothetical protein
VRLGNLGIGHATVETIFGNFDDLLHRAHVLDFLFDLLGGERCDPLDNHFRA